MKASLIILALSSLATGCGTENWLQAQREDEEGALPADPILPSDVTEPPPAEEEDPVAPPVVDDQAVEDCLSGGHAAMNGATGYPTVDDAVQDSSAGDEILICPGVHRGPRLDIRHSLTLEGADPTEGAAVLGFELMATRASDLVISGLTVDLTLTNRGTLGFSIGGSHPGGGSVTVENAVFELGDEHDYRMGMDLSIPAVIRNSRFTGGSLALRPLAFDGVDRFDVEISDTLLEHAHGAIQIDGPGELRLDGVTFDETGGCGAITVTLGRQNPFGNVEPTDIIVTDTAFVSTHAEPSFVFAIGAAVSFREEDSFTCTGCTWTNNDPHDLVRDDEVFDQPGPDLAL